MTAGVPFSSSNFTTTVTLSKVFKEIKLQTSQYNRLRFGISSDFLEGRQVDYVLGEWTANQLDQLNNRLDRCADFVKSFVMSGVKNAMNEYNNT